MARKSKSSKVTVDMKGVESRKRVPAGDHHFRVVEVEKKKGDAADYLAWSIDVAEGKFEGGRIWHNTSLSEKSLWNLKSFLEVLGIEVPDDELELDLTEMVDLEFMGTIAIETYEDSNGDEKKSSRLTDFWALDDEEEDDKKKGKKEDDKKSSRRGKGKDDDGEEDDKKSGRGKGKGKGKKDKEPEGVTEDEVNEMNQDELEEVIKDLELDVDLSDYKTLKRMRAAVIKSADAADLIVTD